MERHRGKLTEMGGFIERLSKARRPIVPICAAWAITANRLLRPDFEHLTGNFASHLARAGKSQGLLLAMHDAQTAEGCDESQPGKPTYRL